MNARWRNRLLPFALYLLLPLLPAQAQTPEATLRAVQTALDTGDVGLFEKYVDMNGVIGRAVDIFLEEAGTPAGKHALPPVLAMLLSSAAESGSDSSVRSLLRHEAAQFVRYGIRSGAFAGCPPEDAPSAFFSGSMLAPLFGDVSLGRKELRDISRPLPDGRDMRIAFTLLDHGNGNVYPVIARLSPTPAGWRIADITNMRALVEQILQEIDR